MDIDRERWKNIRMLVLDVDGVLTDGTILYDGEGRETRTFHVHDGSGIVHLKQGGLIPAVISGRDSAAVRRRLRDMGVEHFSLGRHKKLPEYRRIREQVGLEDHQIAYMGDDLLDLCLLTRVGLALTVPEARPEVKEVCHYVTRAPGGRGAVREVVELLLKAQGKWEKIVASYRI